jgi:hypothetical protein
MDLFTQQYAQYQRADHEVQVDQANAIGHHLAAARARRRRWQRLHAWLRSVGGEATSAANEKASHPRSVAGEQPVKQTVAPT